MQQLSQKEKPKLSNDLMHKGQKCAIFFDPHLKMNRLAVLSSTVNERMLQSSMISGQPGKGRGTRAKDKDASPGTGKGIQHGSLDIAQEGDEVSPGSWKSRTRKKKQRESYNQPMLRQS